MWELISSNFLTLAGIAGLVITGIVVIIGIYDKTRRERSQQADQSEDRLIKLLQAEVGELTKKVDKQDMDIKRLTKEVDNLKTENETLVKVLQGRDEKTAKFYEEAHEAMVIGKQTNTIVIELAKDLRELVGLMKQQTRTFRASDESKS